MMAHTRFWKPTAALCLLPMLLVLGMAAASAQAPTAGKAKVDRLVMGLITPYLDYIPTVWLDVISLVASSCGYNRSEIEQRVAQ
jgi:hypothetical protein